MNQIIPTPLLFEYRLSIPTCTPPARRKTGRLLSLPDSAVLPSFTALSGHPSFAEICAGWNPGGLALAVSVTGKTHPPGGNRSRPENSDCFEVWLDTRPTGNVRRATSYCHRLVCFPADEAADGAPAAMSLPIAQQREMRQEADGRLVRMRCHDRKDGYHLEIWIPADQLYGFKQIEDLRQLGFFCLVRDTELGEQPLTVSDEFPYARDPSLWVGLELTD